MKKIEQVPGEVTFITAIIDYFKGYFDFKGTTTRAGFWWVQLVLLPLLFFLSIIFWIQMFFSLLNNLEFLRSSSDPLALLLRLGSSVFEFSIFSLLALFITVGTIIPSLALTVRRCRDAGLRGRGFAVLYGINLAISLLVIPVIGALVSFIISLCFFIVTVKASNSLTVTTSNALLSFFFRKQ